MLDRAELSRRFANGESFEFLFFWGHRPGKDAQITASCMSQWYVAPFVADGIPYQTAEHYMMAEKAKLFGDESTLQQILVSSDAKLAKDLGRKIQNFDTAVWKSHSRRIVTEANIAKFRNNAPLRQFLINTGNKVLVEASPLDTIWGIGLGRDDPNALHPDTWQGENLLGFALMDVRDLLTAETH